MSTDADTAPQINQYVLDAKSLRLQIYTAYDALVTFLSPEVIQAPISQYQRDVFSQFINLSLKKYAAALPRGHIKTTLSKLAAVYVLLFTDYKFLLYVSGSYTLAENNTRDIVNLLKTPQFTQLFGEVVWHRYREADADYIGEMTSYRFDAAVGDFVTVKKRFILQGRSTGQSIRGMNIEMSRPDYVFMDDIDQDDSAVNSEASYLTTKNWVYSVLLKIGTQRTVFRQIGNFVKAKCVIGDHVVAHDWAHMHYSALLGDGTPLWPEYWTKDNLMLDYQTYEAQGMGDKWFAEMLNNPYENVKGIIRFEEILQLPQILPMSDTYSGAFLTVDPAISNNKTANQTAVIVHVYNRHHNVWQMAEVFAEKGVSAVELFNKCRDLSAKWGIRHWYIESIAYQAVLIGLFGTLKTIAGIDIEVHPTPRTSSTKNARILTWFSMLKNQSYALTEGMLNVIQQVIAFKAETKNNVDDIIDASSDAVLITSTYLDMVLSHAGSPVHLEAEISNIIDVDGDMRR